MHCIFDYLEFINFCFYSGNDAAADSFDDADSTVIGVDDAAAAADGDVNAFDNDYFYRAVFK